MEPVFETGPVWREDAHFLNAASAQIRQKEGRTAMKCRSRGDRGHSGRVSSGIVKELLLFSGVHREPVYVSASIEVNTYPD